MKRTLLSTLVFVFLGLQLHAADTARVLFIGNSYTAVNDLPSIISAMATSGGDVLDYQASIPGGMTLQQHSTNQGTLALINQGNWDFVVLQAQSQEPSFPDSQVEADVYPYAKILDSLIHVASPCAKTVFYMTWGRKYGDQANCAFFPPLCTYLGMDSLLQLRYTIMAEDNHAYISPVARVWRQLRNMNPTIELYSQDESHPSPAGSFAAASSFYAILFNKNPENLGYNYSLNANDAAIIKTMAKKVVFDSLNYWRRFDSLPSSNFVFNQNDAIVTFDNQMEAATSHFWNFGDGETATTMNPTHTYTANGTYNVCLTAIKGCDSVKSCQDIIVSTLSISKVEKESIQLYPNPANKSIVIKGISGSFNYAILDISGRELQSGKSIGATQISIKTLQNGIYFIQFQNEKGNTYRLKFIKM